MKTQGKIAIVLPQVHFIRQIPSPVGKGKFHFVSVTKHLFRWQYLVYRRILESPDVLKRIHDLIFFKGKLLFIGHMLPLAASAIPGIRAGRFDPVRRWGQKFYEQCLGVRLLLLYNSARNPISRYSPPHKNHTPVHSADSPTAVGHAVHEQFYGFALSETAPLLPAIRHKTLPNQSQGGLPHPMRGPRLCAFSF